MLQRRGSIGPRLPNHALTRPRIWWRRPSARARWVMAGAAVGAAIVLVQAMEATFSAAAHTSLFLCATIFSAWFGGFGPGLLTLGLSTIAFGGELLWTEVELGELPRVALFVVAGLFVTSLTASQRTATASLRRARDELAAINAALADEDAERRRAQYLTAQVFESVPDGIAIIDREYAYARVNRAYETYFGVAPGRLVGMSLRDLVPSDVFEFTRTLVDRCLTGEEVRNAGWWLRDGQERRYMAVTYTPLRPQGERVEAALVVSRDLTEHILASEALREAESALAQVTRVATLGEVTASLAHELKQPLAAIVNNANACSILLERGHTDLDEMRAAFIDVAADAQRASAIIERVRALAKRSPPEHVPLALADVVHDVVALAAPESRARRVAIYADVAADLPIVRGDRVQLQQVLLNLIVNGMDAMHTLDAAERRLEIRAFTDPTAGTPTISVRDHGVGLEPGQAHRLFQAFFTTKADGMGLGLAISRTIIESHGGRLWAEEDDGPGATFSFSLPAL